MAQRPLEDFVRALRSADVRVSVAEAMEAHEVVATLGYGDRGLLKDALGLTVAKTVEEKERFSEAFDLFFTRNQFTHDGADAGEDEDPSSKQPSDQPAGDTGNALADMLLSGDREGLAAAMEAAGQAAGVGNDR